MPTFSPSCTFPTSDVVNYVSSCNVRGTLDILWSCMFTLFICTWTAQHLNVPKQQVESSDPSFVKELFGFARAARPKTKWMIIALVLPEFLVGRAVQDWMMARRSSQNKLMKELAARDVVTWSMVHAFYANMGGFVVSIDGLPQSLHTSSGDPHFREIDPLSSEIVHCDPSAKDVPEKDHLPLRVQPSKDNEAVWRGLDHLPPSNRRQGSKSLQALQLHANARQLISLRSWNLISSLPAISAADISSKSRCDSLVKATAIGQVLWLFVSTVARGVRSLPISQLEIATLAFSTCAFATYLFSWHKPQDVHRATFIGSISGLTPRQVNDLLELSGHSLSWHMLGFGPTGPLRKQGQDPQAVLLGPVPNDITYPDLEIRLPLGTRGDTEYTLNYTFLGTGTLLASTVFGAIHCAAWDFQFPTSTEKTLWRVASLVSTLVLMLHPLVHTLKAVCVIWIPLAPSLGVARKVAGLVSGTLTLAVMVAYVLARLFLMVEIFRSLFFLPPEAFVSTWSSSVPHVG